MNARLWICGITLLFTGFPVDTLADAPPESAATHPLTLQECYALALKQSETIAIQQELVTQTEGRFLQALSGALPRASFSLTEKRQDGSGDSALTLKEVPERKFVFSQPLFSGFKEFAAMAGSRAERRERIQEKIRAEQLLLMDVVNSFYLLRQLRQELEAFEMTRAALVERLDELHQRERLGRTRASEVASATAQLRRVEAEIESVRNEEITARQLLEFLTGRSPIGAIADEEPPMPPLDEEGAYVATAPVRSDVRAAQEAWRVAQHQVTIAQAKYWPTIGVDGNYYTKRAGTAQDIDWDVQLKVDVPLFQGGQAVGAVKEAASLARQAKLRFEQTKRQAELDIRDAYANVQAAVRRTAAFEKAREAAEESYRLQAEDYRHNLVSNLDVLKALQDLQDARRDVIQAQAALKQRDWALKTATGETLEMR